MADLALKADYWETPPDKHLSRAYWDDPMPQVQGMLTSDYIAFYNRAITTSSETEHGMIRPFDPDLLKPASYELTLGDRCMVEGEDVVLTHEKPWLTIPPNSIVFVSMRQILVLPHYIVGRFDLAIDFIYQGLLLGTGPQVDPGFQGALGCPLHNISNSPIHMQLDQPFAKLDFVKTAPPLRARRRALLGDPRRIDSERDFAGFVQGAPGHPDETKDVKIFKSGLKGWRQPIYDYIGNKRPTSSVHQLHKTVRRFERYGVAGLVTIALAAGGLIVAYVNASTHELASKSDVTRVEGQSATSARELKQRLKAAEKDVRTLTRDVAALRAKVR